MGGKSLVAPIPVGLWIYFRFKERHIDAAARLRYLDIIAYVFPFAWAIGRAACTVAHGHATYFGLTPGQ